MRRSPLPGRAETVPVGRAHEYGVLGAALREAGSQGRLLAVHGRPGMGKTTLVETALRQVERDGHLVVRMRPGPWDTPDLGRLADQVCESLAGEGTRPGEVPVRARLLRRGPDGLPLMLRTLSAVLRSAGTRPVAVLFDDAHLLAAGDRGPVAALLHGLRSAGACVLVRGVPEAVDPGMARGLAAVADRTVELGPLTASQCAELIGRVLGVPPAADLVAAVRRGLGPSGAGAPGPVVRAVGALRERDRLVVIDGRVHLADPHAPIPMPRLAARLAEWLPRVDRSVRAGDPFPGETLALLTRLTEAGETTVDDWLHLAPELGATPDRLGRLLDTLVTMELVAVDDRQRLVCTVPAAAGLLGDRGEDDVARLHARLVLDVHRPHRTRLPAPRLVDHALAAGTRLPAALRGELLLSAVRREGRHEPRRTLAACRALLQTLPADDGNLPGVLRVGVPLMLRHGRPADLLELGDRLLPRLAPGGLRGRVAQAWALAALHEQWLGTHPVALPAPVAPASSPIPGPSPIPGSSAVPGYSEAPPSFAASAVQGSCEALAVQESYGVPASSAAPEVPAAPAAFVVPAARASSASAASSESSASPAVPEPLAAPTSSASPTAPASPVSSASPTSSASQVVRQVPGAAVLLTAVARLDSGWDGVTGRDGVPASGASYAIREAFGLGDLVGCWAALPGQRPTFFPESPLHAHRSLVREYLTGSWEAALDLAGSLEAGPEAGRHGPLYLHSRALAAEICRRRGDPARAAAWLDRIADDVPPRPLLTWARLGLRHDRGDPADTLRDGRRECRELWRAGRTAGLERPLLRLLGHANRDPRDAEGARAALELLEELDAVAPSRLTRAAALVGRALVRDDVEAAARGYELLAAHGGRQAAYSAAVWLLRRTGEPRRLRDAWRHQEGMASRPARDTLVRLAAEFRLVVPRGGGGRPGPDVLDPRIIEMVVGGSTNRQIGAALARSEKSVEAHLARIFRRTGCRSRAELATAWLDGGLRHTAPGRTPL